MASISTETLLQELNLPLCEEKKLTVFILRLDRIHPFISGNKFYKLKYNLKEFTSGKYDYLVTLGGAFSNHVAATAAAGKEFNIPTIGIIRGNELNDDSNEVLRFAAACGMKLVFISRELYRFIRNDPGKLISEGLLPHSVRNSKLYFLPEGGSNELAIKGCEEILKNVSTDFDYACCAVGTGATLAGIAKSLLSHQKALGISILSGEHFLKQNVTDFGADPNSFEINFNYHFGGYANSTPELNLFCKSFSESTRIPIEPVYTGKLFYCLMDLISNDFFAAGKTIVAIHTGGIFPSHQ